MKTNEGTSQLEKRLIGRAEFLPADQEPAPTIEPGEQPLDHPAPGLLCHFQVVCRNWRDFMQFERFLIPGMIV